MPAVENDGKALGKWMMANGIKGAPASQKFLKALEKQIGKNAKTIDVKVLAAVKKSCGL